MTPQTSDASSGNQGLAALVMLLRFQGVSIDAAQVRHQFGTEVVGIPEMLRMARQLGLKARETHALGPPGAHAVSTLIAASCPA